MVAFFFPPTSGLSSSLASISYVGSAGSNSNTTNYTFNGVAIGSAATDRIVPLVVMQRLGSGVDPTGVTINGTAMTFLASVNDGTINTSLWSVPRGVVPTGTTADFVVSNSGSRSMCYINTWRIVGQNSDTPYQVLTKLKAGGSLTLTLSMGTSFTDGATLGTASAPNLSTSFTWSGLTESYDTNTESTNCTITGANANSLPASITATAATPVTGLMGIAATWR